MTVTFDTLQLAKKLEAAGFTEAQAEGLASSLSHIQAAQIENLATKQDLKELTSATRADIALLKRDLKELEARVVLRLGGLIVVGIGVLALLIKL